MANDLWRTPPRVIDFIERRFGKIEIDLCASKENAVCETFIDEACDFLNDRWVRRGQKMHKKRIAWLNPPYSNPLPFVKQAIKWSKNGCAVAGILNNDTSTKWFVELQNHAAIIMPIVGGRVAFLNERGEPVKGNNKPQVMFYLAPFGSKTQVTRYVNINEIFNL